MTLTEEARKARNEYARKWREKNRDKVKDYNERYWARRAQEAAKAAQEGVQGDLGGGDRDAAHTL